MNKKRTYDEVGRNKIREFLKDCKDIADLGCNDQLITDYAVGYDIDGTFGKEVDFNKEGTWGYDNSYNGICASHLLEHIIDTRDFLISCFYVLKDGGRIAVIVPNGETVPSSTLGDSCNTHEMLFTPTTLKLYLENAGFKNVFTEYYDRPYAWKKTKGIFGCGEK